MSFSNRRVQILLKVNEKSVARSMTYLKRHASSLHFYYIVFLLQVVLLLVPK